MQIIENIERVLILFYQTDYPKKTKEEENVHA
jgi:hypothetical protein